MNVVFKLLKSGISSQMKEYTFILIKILRNRSGVAKFCVVYRNGVFVCCGALRWYVYMLCCVAELLSCSFALCFVVVVFCFYHVVLCCDLLLLCRVVLRCIELCFVAVASHFVALLCCYHVVFILELFLFEEFYFFYFNNLQ